MEVDDGGGGGAADSCVICGEGVAERAFTWPGCRNADGPVARRVCSVCLSAMLGSLPGWPGERPTAEGAADAIREAVRRGSPGRELHQQPPAHLPCPVCRHQWTDIGHIAAAAMALPSWPAPRGQGGHRPQASERPGLPRPLLGQIFCAGLDREEMVWSTYQRQIRDHNDPLQSRRGEWAGEWQCEARRCTSEHIAPPESLAAAPPEQQKSVQLGYRNPWRGWRWLITRPSEDTRRQPGTGAFGDAGTGGSCCNAPCVKVRMRFKSKMPVGSCSI